MAKKKVRSVFYDLYPEDQAVEMEMRSLLLQGLERWLIDSEMTQSESASTPARWPLQKAKNCVTTSDLVRRWRRTAALNFFSRSGSSLTVSVMARACS